MLSSFFGPATRSAHLHGLIELAEEVLLQAVAQVGREAAAAVDSECRGQRLAQHLHEGIPLPLRHNPLDHCKPMDRALSLVLQPPMPTR